MNEHMEVPIQDITYEMYLWELETKLHLAHIFSEIIGCEISERTGINYPIYRLVINPEVVRKICIISGVHGNEIAGPLSILTLLVKVHERLPKNFQYLIYPVVNPTGFDLRQRFDADMRDLNAIYKTTLHSKNYREVQCIFEDLEKQQPFEAVLTLHEDSDVEEFYMYGLGHDNRSFYHAICEHAQMYCPSWKNADIYGNQSDEQGLILSTARDHAFDGKLYANKMARIACTLETPGKREISFRVQMMADLVTFACHLMVAGHGPIQNECLHHR